MPTVMPQDKPTIESSLAAIEAEADAALAALTALVRTLKAVKASAANGQVRDLEKAIGNTAGQIESVQEQIERLSTAWTFDTREYMESGAYTEELMAAIEKENLKAVFRDGRILCFPSLLRVLPGDAAVEMDRKKVRRLRPRLIAQELKRHQGKKSGLRSEQFIEILHEAYVPLASQQKGMNVVRLLDIYDILTLLPQAADYSKQEFARDLLQLDMSDVRKTKSGARIRFSASTLARTSALTAVSPQGETKIYAGVEFKP